MALAACVLLLCGVTFPGVSDANTVGQINTAVNAALARFDQEFKGAAKFIAASPGVLVFPEVVKGAFLYGQQYGEGALRVNGNARSFAYYSFTAKWGASTAVLSKDVIFVFRDAGVLRRFELTAGWTVGTDAPATLVHVGPGADLSTMRVTGPIAGFVVGPKGLMYDFALTGAKIGLLNK
jgi:lipid-binding SYLF domain-containing protein